MAVKVSRRKNFSKASAPQDSEPLLRISEVARRVGISSSALRAWESLGLVIPKRTESRYRLYSVSDVRLLQRAIFLRRARGLNPAAIVHVLKRQGVVSVPAESVLSPGQRFRRLRQRRDLSLLQVARATGVSVGFLSALERGQMRASVATLTRIARFYRTNLLSFFESKQAAAAANHTHTKARNFFTSFAAHLKFGLATKNITNSSPATASTSK